jgi:hypothetical protein
MALGVIIGSVNGNQLGIDAVSWLANRKGLRVKAIVSGGLRVCG